MDPTFSVPDSSRVREIEGNVPLPVVVWLEHHPTAPLACALSVSAPKIQWYFRVSPTVEVHLRAGRVLVVDTGTGHTIGSARMRGLRSAADFDALPKALEPPPFSPPDVPFPALCGFACDLDGRVARLTVAGGRTVGPGLPPRVASYAHEELKIDTLVAALAVGHTGVAHPIAAFATRVRDLVAVLGLPTVVGGAKLYCWFEDDRVVVWPAAPSELTRLAVSALHARGACLGCSRHDPRDALGRGTYRYTRPAHSRLDSLVRDDVPIEPLTVPQAAALLGRSPAELAATQLPVRFSEATRVDMGQVRRAD